MKNNKLKLMNFIIYVNQTKDLLTVWRFSLLTDFIREMVKPHNFSTIT